MKPILALLVALPLLAGGRQDLPLSSVRLDAAEPVAVLDVPGTMVRDGIVVALEAIVNPEGVQFGVAVEQSGNDGTWTLLTTLFPFPLDSPIRAAMTLRRLSDGVWPEELRVTLKVADAVAVEAWPSVTVSIYPRDGKEGEVSDDQLDPQ